ncbi:GD23967 [Drosophila simulans]|uniref:GD23967 n=1 Tax=Drosophila simulans TaxID=7240 RepID=B4Q5K4_DROSI|nr:GD23967 [Drosophila simulans]
MAATRISHHPTQATHSKRQQPTANSQHQCQRQAAEQDADVFADGSADVSADKATAATSDRRKKRVTHQVSWAKKDEAG